jgi:site-specific DNA-methyltransferase (adenine-specific)
MGDESADLWLVDPPYNVSYIGKTKDALTIENDHMQDEEFLQFLTDACTVANHFMREGAVFYIWHADSEGYNFRSAVKLTG